MLLTNTHILKLSKVFPNNSSANINSSKTQFHKIRQSGGFVVRLLGPIVKTDLPLKGNVLKN